MTCQTTCNYATIIQGSTKELNVFVKKASTGEPLDLTGATQIKAIFRKDDDTLLTKTLSPPAGITVISAVGGKFKVTLSAADTGDLHPGDKQDWEIEITIGSNVYVVQFEQGLEVIERLV